MITQGKVTEIFYMTDNCSKVSDDRMKKNNSGSNDITNKLSFTLP